MSAIFVESSLLSNERVRFTLEEIKETEMFPVIPLNHHDDIKRVEFEGKVYQDNLRIVDMSLLIVLEDFESDLFQNILKRLKNRTPKVIFIHFRHV